MGVALSGYCYADLSSAALTAGSLVGQSVAGDAVLSSVIVSGSAIEWTYTTVSTGDFRTYSVTPTSCPDVGPLHGGAFGLSLADSAALSFLVVGAWATAWAVSVLRRGLIA